MCSIYFFFRLTLSFGVKCNYHNVLMTCIIYVRGTGAPKAQLTLDLTSHL